MVIGRHHIQGMAMKKGAMLIFGSPKRDDDEDDEDDDEGDADVSGEKLTHAKAILAAIRDDDAESLVEALEHFIECCHEDA